MINAETQAWLARREEAGRVIDVETCKLTWCWGKIADPYGVDPESDDCIGRNTFVASADGGPWVSLHDLPPDKISALRARINRGELHEEEVPLLLGKSRYR